MNLPVSLEGGPAGFPENSTSPVVERSAPVVRIVDADAALSALPRCGTITFRFEREEARVTERAGAQHLDLTLRLCAIEAVEEHDEEHAPVIGQKDFLDELFEEAMEDEAELNEGEDEDEES